MLLFLWVPFAGNVGVRAPSCHPERASGVRKADVVTKGGGCHLLDVFSTFCIRARVLYWDVFGGCLV